MPLAGKFMRWKRAERARPGNANNLVRLDRLGLVSVPVRMESAVKEHKLEFHFVHEPDGARIGYQKICKAEDKPVPDDEIVKAFELERRGGST